MQYDAFLESFLGDLAVFWNKLTYVSLLCQFGVFCDGRQDLTFWMLCGNLWAIRFIEIKSDSDDCAIFDAEKKKKAIFTTGRIKSETVFLRPDRCMTAERTTEYGLRQTWNREQNPQCPCKEKLDAAGFGWESSDVDSTLARIREWPKKSDGRVFEQSVGSPGRFNRLSSDGKIWNEWLCV